MIAEIIKIKDGKFIPTTNALGIPEFLALWENVEYPEIYFLYIHYKYYPISAYSELSESDRDYALIKDFPIDENEPYFIMAAEKAEQLYKTPLKRGFLATKKVYDLLNQHMDTLEEVTLGRDGNYGNLESYLNKSADNMKAYTAAEEQYKKEISVYGSKELGFDDDYNYQDSEIDLNS